MLPFENSLSALFSWLEERARDVRRMEQDALRELERNNIQAYRDGMRRKAELLAALPGDALPLLHDLPEDAAPAIRKVQEGLWRFAGNAGNALALDSVFYMSALLYPEDYREGEANDLEVFLEEQRVSALQ